MSSLFGLVAVLHFVCPLIFFTDLTRNPYVTQIVLLNIGLLAAAAWWLCGRLLGRGPAFRRTPLDLPWLCWAAVCGLSWLWAYFGHAEFYRESMRSEGLRTFLFLGVNAAAPFFLAVHLAGDCPEEHREPAGAWALFVLVWGGLWLLFPQLRGGSGALTSVAAHVWDPYGVLLWAGGTVAVLYLVRSGTAHAVWHLALSVGFLGAAYACAQYFRLEFLWPRTLDPYGGRSVSTFGNPNFMSSYLVMLLPLAAVYGLKARSRGRKLLYLLLFLCLEAGLLCSLTRSSWIGAAVALAPLILSRRLREAARQDLEFTGAAVTAALLLAALWPRIGVVGYESGILSRLVEMKDLASDSAPTYSPWYQRLLIWSCAWLMGAENPLLGKGWGLFELFYPFYQGHFLREFEVFSTMRTHANNTHNEVLEIWAQTGLAGLGIAAWMWTAFFRSLAIPALGSRRGKEGGGSVWLLASASGVAGMLADNLLNVSLHFAVPAFLFWWQAGSAMGQLARAEGWERRDPFSGRGARRAASVLLVGLAALGAWQWVRYWNREVRYFMGFKLMRRGDPRQALLQLRKAYEWHPREVNNNYEMANAYARSERFEKAVWAYEEALRANAGYDEIYFNLATIQLRMGRTDDAVRNYRVSWAINPHSPQTYANLANVYLQTDPARYRKEALAVLSDAARFYPDNVNFLNNLGYVHSLGGDFERAEELYARILRLDPDSEVAERNLRTSLLQSRRPPPPILQELGEYRRLQAMMRERRLDREALQAARRVHESFPASSPVAFYLATLELMNGESRRAEELYRVLLAREPRNVAALANLAQALRAQGRGTEAADALRSALALEPQNGRLREELERISK